MRGVTNLEEAHSNVLGGEVALWTEQVTQLLCDAAIVLLNTTLYCALGRRTATP